MSGGDAPCHTQPVGLSFWVSLLALSPPGNRVCVGEEVRLEMKNFAPRISLDGRSLTLSGWEAVEQWTGRAAKRGVWYSLIYCSINLE